MMGLEVKQILKSLCFSHGWSYAVLWCYDSINPMLLRFEEAYSDEQSVAVVDDMIIQPHILGQGTVGEAALTGNHQWLFLDTLLLLQCEHEFQNQFLSGFKTIAIIPVGSRGVVQFGSTQKILASQELLEQTKRALCLKPDQPVVELDTLFDSLVPLGDCENIVPESLQGLSFEDIFREEDNPPSLFSPETMVTGEAPLNTCHVTNVDDFGFDILKSYSLDDLYQLLAEENSTVIQGNDKDLFDIFGDSSSVSHQGFAATQPPLASSTPKFQGLFSELISSSLSTNTISSSLTNVQDYYYDSGLSQSKKRKLETSSAQSSSLFPQMEEEERSSVAGNWKKPHEEGVKKKRAKAGESRKPRPKDRQMIQDRIKELRGMIPNGSKCSIDTLLDLTIRHMVFMQSIAMYADKLKQPYEPKLVKEKERTWALEVNGDDESSSSSVICPIIVEDLKPQGQMEIEMVCEESGQFLEISDVIRGLGLNILKGVMERRQGQIWSHFIVEAKPQVTRLQVFWSLVQLFQQKHHINMDS